MDGRWQHGGETAHRDTKYVQPQLSTEKWSCCVLTETSESMSSKINFNSSMFLSDLLIMAEYQKLTKTTLQSLCPEFPVYLLV